MMLSELFQKPTKYEVIKQSSTIFGTKAMIRDREIRFYAVESERGDFDEWDVSFGEVKKGTKEVTAELTGSGGELEVLGMVKDSIKEFIQRYHPKAIHFTASKSDRSRASVYERMVKRLLPSDWKFEKQENDAHDVSFTLRHS